jgi:hypothetical protein
MKKISSEVEALILYPEQSPIYLAPWSSQNSDVGPPARGGVFVKIKMYIFHNSFQYCNIIVFIYKESIICAINNSDSYLLYIIIII